MGKAQLKIDMFSHASESIFLLEWPISLAYSDSRVPCACVETIALATVTDIAELSFRLARVLRALGVVLLILVCYDTSVEKAVMQTGMSRCSKMTVIRMTFVHGIGSRGVGDDQCYASSGFEAT